MLEESRNALALLSTLHKLPKRNVKVYHKPAILSTPRHFHNMALFPRFTAGDFTPLFRLLDDYDHHRSSNQQGNNVSSSLRSFTPKFDVREVNDSYHLDGELPGINQKDIDIEFTDEQTLVIKGRSKREYTATNENEFGNEAATAADDAASHKSTSHQPTVEDEDAPASTPTSPANTESKEMVKQGSASKAMSKKPAYRYWVTERSVGEFQRTFSFPTRVNQEGVRASLKDGILHVVVPKAAAPISKKIRID
ncbi:hypothetical protein PRK78_000678 [Emydomyces testavorans]|uniref:SHSP domain-containing protein n=1 Tax=Emydomyces testavorans TaxID=2070801 RepID=A0AAF0DBW5_9EURO|nr:hypothetical protein PRK78_000678 [Emydomyces testavorans]